MQEQTYDTYTMNIQSNKYKITHTHTHTHAHTQTHTHTHLMIRYNHHVGMMSQGFV